MSQNNGKSIASWLAMCTWLFALPFQTGQSSPVVAGVIAAIAAVLLARTDVNAFPCRPKRAILVATAISTAVFVLYVPIELAIPGLLMLTAIALHASGEKSVSRASERVSLALFSTLLLSAIYVRFGSGVHALPWMTDYIGGVSAYAGLRATPLGDAISVRTDENLYSFMPTMESIGVWPCAMLVTSFLIVTRESLNLTRMFAVVGVSIVYCFFRVVALLVFAIDQQFDGIFWRPTAVGLSFLPLALLFGSRLVIEPVTLPQPNVGSGKGTFAGAGILLCAAACLYGAVTWVEPGTKKQGRILIDEAHSDWERTDTPMDTVNYGPQTTYNYSSLASFLSYYYSVSRNYVAIEKRVLDATDILVLKTPTRAYSHSEANAIFEFVRSGGALLMVGDHTNVFGTSTYLNPVSSEFGITFMFDAEHDIHTGGLSLYKRAELGCHPAIWRLPPFLFATSCTLSLRLDVDPIQVGCGLATRPGSYSERGFFSPNDTKIFGPFGTFVQSASTTCGRGRVVAFADSTVWSNFFMYVKGKPELILGLMDWLNRENTWPSILRAALLISGVAGFGAFWSLRARLQLPIMSGMSIAAIVLGIVATDATRTELVRRWYPAAATWRTMPTVAFVHGPEFDYFLPETRLFDEEQMTYLTFYTWVNRIGLVPTTCSSIAEATASGARLVILVRRRTCLTAVENQVLADFINGGGSLIVIPDEKNPTACSSVLAEVGMSLKQRYGARELDELPSCMAATLPAASISKEGRDWLSELWLRVPWRVEGGRRWLGTRADSMISFVRTAAGGIVVATAGSEVFSDKTIGHSGTRPTDAQRSLFDLEYGLLRLASEGVMGR